MSRIVNALTNISVLCYILNIKTFIKRFVYRFKNMEFEFTKTIHIANMEEIMTEANSMFSTGNISLSAYPLISLNLLKEIRVGRADGKRLRVYP